MFLLVVDTLDRVLRVATEQKIFAGVGLQNISSLFQSLQFADNTLLFCSADILHVKILKFLLDSFELITGLKINFDKSQVIGLQLDNWQTGQVASIPRSKTTTLPMSIWDWHSTTRD